VVGDSQECFQVVQIVELAADFVLLGTNELLSAQFIRSGRNNKVASLHHQKEPQWI
jgi:hypothetical protein